MPEREYGVQPLELLMQEAGLDNHALVAASTEQLTHKMVAKGRNGRFLSVKVRQKVLRAYNKATGSQCTLENLFNY